MKSINKLIVYGPYDMLHCKWQKTHISVAFPDYSNTFPAAFWKKYGPMMPDKNVHHTVIFGTGKVFGWSTLHMG